MAVMRSGRLVQSGSLAEVWRHPADAETARFLGYASVLEGARAGRLAEAAGLTAVGERAGVLALRRSALKVDPDGALVGRVLSGALAPDRVRLRVEIEGLGELDAVGRSDVPLPPPGERVHLAVDVSRVAVVGEATEMGSGPVGGVP
jgi:thiamine transport system ATP-binding protein